jgi:glucose-1-phosphate thymidylyltransferase
MESHKNKLVGIIPAAGSGTRLFPYNAGKELLPVGSQRININGKIEERPKIVSQYIIEAMAKAGVDQIIIVTNPAKHSLMGLHLDGSKYGIPISYIVQHPPSMAHSIDLAYHLIKSSTVVMGMPDTIVSPDNSIEQLVKYHWEGEAELSLGLFSTNNPQKFGMVKTDRNSNIVYHEDKPIHSDATTMWGLAVWEPSFTQTLHETLHQPRQSVKEMALGDVFDIMLAKGKTCKAFPIKDGKYYDIGTYDDYKRAIQEL